ncbi:MAG: Type 1 glutamine amidotransferase-like domain-containing protein [Candidatus Staskawiczbacteria bacterium]|nr:Type 1 glutamine amidotransferase-like domain-containing protein [Candidatus Staskawiczbacteria bacterium]
MKKLIFFLVIFLFLATAGNVSAHQPRIIYLQSGDVKINNPEISQAFYDELKGQPRDYFIDSSKDFDLYINLLVPNPENKDSRYFADVFDSQDKKIFSLDGNSFAWQEFYEPFGRDYYLKGPELDEKLPAGKYKIEVFSKNNSGKYVLAVGKTESFDALSILNIYWQLPLLKISFFKTSVLQFFLTPFGIGGVAAIGALLIFLALIYYLVGLIKGIVRHNMAKTLLLTSNGMQMKNEIIKLLQKPAYDVTVAFITTAAKPEENLDYLKKDWNIMRDELGFNVEEVDIDGKTESEVMKLLELKDIIFVEGGNTFYLLKSMRECNFEKVIRKLLKWGKVYIGASAGSIVAGKTIKTAGWKNGDKNMVGLKNLKGLNLVGFDIFVHYQPENAETIKQQIKNPRKRAKKLKILTDGQAILVQGREVALIGEGEAVIV